MDDYRLMMAKMRDAERMREAAKDRRAAEARRAARTEQMVRTAARAPVIRPAHWLAMAAGRVRPTMTGR